MARKSANDGITTRYEPPSVLASRLTQSERSRKLISFRGLAAHFLLWIRITLSAGKKEKRKKKPSCLVSCSC